VPSRWIRILAVPLVPIFPLDLVLFPGIPLPLHIFESRYKEMIGECLATKSEFGLVRAQPQEESNAHAIAEIGCTAEVVAVVKRYDDGRMDIITEGRRRFELLQLNQERPFLRAEVLFFDDNASATPPENDKVLQLHSEMMSVLGGSTELNGSEVAALSFRLAASVPTDLDFKQTLLAMRSEAERVNLLIEYYTAIIPKLKHTAETRRKAAGNGHVV
jgi:Lon protease-like protein